MTTKAIDSIRASEEKRHHADRMAWRELVDEVADAEQSGQQIDGEGVAARLAALGKSSGELETDVARKLRRREAQASIEPARQARAELSELHATIERKIEERNAAIAAANAELESLNGQVNRLSNRADGETRALQILRDTADPHVKAELERAVQQRGELLSRLALLDGHMGRQRDDAKRAREEASKRRRRDFPRSEIRSGRAAQIDREAAKAADEAAAEIEAAIAEAEGRQAQLRSAIAEADKRIDALEEELTKP